jgi:transcriptional/translational regulatory protein YebC/TACO1
MIEYLMAGHSHSKNVRVKKNKVDALKASRNKQFSQRLRIALNSGNASLLESEIQIAKKNNIPSSVIDNVLNSKTSEKLENRVYEAYIKNVALIIEAETDNPNRTVSLVREVLSRNGGALGKTLFLFDKIGRITSSNLDNVFECDLIEDFEEKKGKVYSYTKVENLFSAFKFLDGEDMEIIFQPKEFVDTDISEVIEDLEEIDDVIKVYSNSKITED